MGENIKYKRLDVSCATDVLFMMEKQTDLERRLVLAVDYLNRTIHNLP